MGQTPPSKRSKAPFVSGRFRNNLKYRGATDSQFKIGWDARGFIVNHLATLKRFVTTQKRPFPRDVRIEIDRQVDREIGRKLPPSKKTKIVFFQIAFFAPQPCAGGGPERGRAPPLDQQRGHHHLDF